MIDFKTDVLVVETKGLLREAECDIKNVRYNLAFDNITKLPDDLKRARQLLDAIEEKVKNYSDSITEEDDEAIY